LKAIDELLGNENFRKIEFRFFAPNFDALDHCGFSHIIVENLELAPYTQWGVIRNVIKLRKTIKKFNPDIIHCQSIVPDSLIIYILTLTSTFKNKIIITSHGLDLVLIPEMKYGTRCKARIRFLTKMILKKVDKLILPSQSLVKYALDAGIRNDKIEIIQNGVKPRKSNASVELIDQIKKKLNIKQDQICLLSLSSFIPIKDIDSLIEGIAIAQREVKNIRLFLAGGGILKEKLENKIYELNLCRIIHFIGQIVDEEKDAYFRICKIFCITSIYENMPISILEAMGYGKAIIATNVGGISEVIKNDYNGILVPAKSPHHIAGAVQRLCGDVHLTNRLSESAKCTASKYNISDIALKHLDLYQQIISNNELRRCADL